MAHVDFFLLKCHLYLSWQLEQAQVVGYSSAAFAHALGYLLLSHLVVLHQVLVCQSYFYGVEVLALYVLDECHLHHTLIADGTDIGWYGSQANQLGGTPATLTCDNLEAVLCHLSQGNGLNDAYGLDAFCQLMECFVVELATRLVGVGFYLVERNLVDGTAALCAHSFGRDKCVETSSQGIALGSVIVFLVYCHFLFLSKE